MTTYTTEAYAEARSYLRDAGISDPTNAMAEIIINMLSEIREAVAEDPTLNDYAGEITTMGDSAAAEMDLDAMNGSHDALTYDHGLGETEGIEGYARAVAYELCTSIAARAVEDLRPSTMDVPWSKIPTTSHGDVLIGRSDENGYVYVSVEYDEGRLSISGHTTEGSAGQCLSALDGLTPAPWYSAGDLAELRRVWNRWHLNDMQAGCEHQRAVPDWCGVGMACPVCGYSYGSAWLREEVPADVLRFLSRFDASRDDAFAQILRSANPNDPSEQWSVYDVARAMVGRPDLTLEDMEATRAAIGRLCPDGGRYVGGTSGHLYHLPR
jgi:hypothetical protein